LRQERA
jgi:hypothetical protein